MWKNSQQLYFLFQQQSLIHALQTIRSPPEVAAANNNCVFSTSTDVRFISRVFVV